jgi:hypothetical protein
MVAITQYKAGLTSDYSEPFPNPFGQPEWVEAFKIAV